MKPLAPWLLACSWLCLACQPSGDVHESRRPEAAPELAPIAPRPLPREELGRLPAAAREGFLQRLDALERKGDGAAWGDLALDFHALLLLDAGAAAYGQAMVLSPREPRWTYLAGYLAYQQRRREDALVLMERTLVLDPDHRGALYWKAELLFELQRFDDSRRDLEALLAREPGHAAALAQLGHLAAAEGRFEEAVELFRRVLELQPEASAMHYPLAQALRQSGRPDEASALEFGEQQVTRDDPDLALLLERTRRRRGEMARLAAAPDPALGEGRRLAAEGRWDEARSSFASALARSESESAEAMARFGLALVALEGPGDCNAALENLERVLALQPGLLEAHLARVECLGRQGRWREAEEQLRQALRRRPESTILEERLVRVLAAAPDPSVRRGEEAFELGRRLVGREPSGENYEAFAMALAELGRFPEAVDVQTEVLRVARAGGRSDLESDLVAHLQAYREGRPCREPWPAPSTAVEWSRP